MRLIDLVMYFDELSGAYPIHEDTPGKPFDFEDRFFGPDWVETDDLFFHGRKETYALDCEMVQTTEGSAVGRVSLVNWRGKVIFDVVVKPDARVTDFRTRYSGLTKQQVLSSNISLEDVQYMILRRVTSEDIIIGHAVFNDLRVLKLKHPKIIDTAHCFGTRASRPSLKNLAARYLRQDIQNGSHDSVEDARACLNLVKLRLRMD